MKKLNNELELIKMLSQSYGDFNSYLEKIYISKIVKLIINSNVDDVRLWLTLNEIVSRLKLNGLITTSKELQFLLTEKSLNKIDITLLLDRNIDLNDIELVRLNKKLKKIWNL